MNKICVVTGARSDYGLLAPVMQKIKDSAALQLQLIVTTMHTSESYGLTIDNITEDGFSIDESIENLVAANTSSGICKSAGLAMCYLADSFKKLQPDMVLLLGDRFEAHAAATSALLMNIPITHLHGGEVTSGAVDDFLRNSISQMAKYHFTSTEGYKLNLVKMGINPNNIVVSGAPGIDNIKNIELLDKESLEQELGWKFGAKTILFSYHSETMLTLEQQKQQLDIIIGSLQQLAESYHILFSYANADQGGELINHCLEELAQSDATKFKILKNLGQKKYLSVLKHVHLLAGNSSSGIIEAASFQLPVVNIGDRQQGRSHSGNVVNCNASEFVKAVSKATSADFINQCKKVVNIYGQGNAAEAIVQNLTKWIQP